MKRSSRTLSGTLTRYLLDTQPGLTVVLAETTGSATTRYVHGPTGILAQQKKPGAKWVTSWTLQDGLQSVRAIADGMNVLSAQAYSPYGEPMFTDMPTEFGFTGEQTDPLNDLIYLRARYMNPRLGIFGSLDPFEGELFAPLTMNGYGWVEGNVTNLIDPQGTCSYNSNKLPCPIPNGQHPMVQTSYDLEWIQSLGFCKQDKTGSWYMNTDLIGISDQISATYGFYFPQTWQFNTTVIGMPIVSRRTGPWTWDELAGVARGGWLISKALETTPLSSSGADAVRNMYQNTPVILWTGRDNTGTLNTPLIPDISVLLAESAIEIGRASAVVPPPGIIGTYKGQVFLKPGNRNSHETFIHELGHVLDFELGSAFSTDTFNTTSNPSTMLYNDLQMSYPTHGYNNIGACAGLTGSNWGACIATRGAIVDVDLLNTVRGLPGTMSNLNPRQTNYFNAAGGYGLYGGGAPTDHFEDFATTWAGGILAMTAKYHSPTGVYNSNMDSVRNNFMTNYMWQFFMR